MTNHEYARLLLAQPEVPMVYESCEEFLLDHPRMMPVTDVPEIQEVFDFNDMLRLYELHKYEDIQFDETKEGYKAYDEWMNELSKKIAKEASKIKAIVIE